MENDVICPRCGRIGPWIEDRRGVAGVCPNCGRLETGKRYQEMKGENNEKPN